MTADKEPRDHRQVAVQDVKIMKVLAEKAFERGGNVFQITIMIGDVTVTDAKQAHALPGAITEALAAAIENRERGQIEADERRVHEMRVLEECDWNRKHAAKLLGFSEKTMHTRIAEWREQGCEIPDNPAKGSRRPSETKGVELWDVFSGGV